LRDSQLARPKGSRENLRQHVKTALHLVAIDAGPYYPRPSLLARMFEKHIVPGDERGAVMERAEAMG
jgi:hypothetical protein